MSTIIKIRFRIYTLLPWVLIVLLLPTRHHDAKAQSASVEHFSLSFKEELTIGGEMNEDASYFLASPYRVRTDSRQNIYIAEGQQKTILVFSPEGEYRRSIGQSGNGPGEFPTGPIFSFNHQDKIMAFDFESQRVTWFSKQGDILQEHAPSEAGMVWSRKFRQTADGNYIVLKKPKDIGNGTPDRYRTKVLHLYDKSFERRMVSFGNFNDLLSEAGSKFVKMISNRMNSGNFLLAGDENLWYAPGIYDGKIYNFKKVNSEWKKSDTFSGQLNSRQAVELNVEGPATTSIVTYNSEGQERSNGKINGYSIGLLQVSDGRVLHFSGQRMQNQDSLQTMVEVFSPQGELIGTGRFDEIAIPRNLGYFSSNTPSVWMDENDQFYFIDHRNVPAVRVGQIEGL